MIFAWMNNQSIFFPEQMAAVCIPAIRREITKNLLVFDFPMSKYNWKKVILFKTNAADLARDLRNRGASVLLFCALIGETYLA